MKMQDPVELKTPDIKYRVLIYELGDEGDELEAAVLQFSGAYGYGSLGNGDAIYMIAIRDFIVELVNPCALIFDLRELQYEWGNAIWAMFQCAELPFATIVSDKCSGFQTCGVAEPMFEALDPALVHLQPLAMAYERWLLE